jgi:lipopolysaccharide/colanic/teichoic acid biosynthesis glycosyltransferase
MGRNATSFDERMMLDEYYISNWSIWLDLFIVIKTVWVLISGQGR